jgi:hypothetical protein
VGEKSVNTEGEGRRMWSMYSVFENRIRKPVEIVLRRWRGDEEE